MIIKSLESIPSGMKIIQAEMLAKLKEHPEGIVIEITEFKPKRTNLQNNFYWANIKELVKLLRQFNVKAELFGVKVDFTDDMIHQINKAQFNIESSAKLSKNVFIDFMDSMFAFWIEHTKGEWQPQELTRTYMERTGLI